MSTSRTERAVDLLVCVGVEDVMRQTGWKRRTAYWHLRRASGREPGARGSRIVLLFT
jgi:hypothetical protein